MQRSRSPGSAARGDLRVVLVTLLPQAFDPARQPVLYALAARARSVGMNVVDLAPTLGPMALSDKQRWLNATGHFSPEANAWVAARIAERLHPTEASRPLPP